MATDNQDNENNTAAPSLSQRGAARRRVTRAGLGAVGVLSTLSAHATLQTTSMCSSPSNWAQSAGVVNSHIPAPKCTGKTSSQWWGMCSTTKSYTTNRTTGVTTTTITTNAVGWPGGCTASTMFSSVFYVNPTGSTCPSRTDSKGNTLATYDAGSYYCATFADLLKGQGCDPSGVGKEFVAAYMNIAKGYVGKGALVLTDLQNMWYELQMKGVYNATATVSWSPAQVADYLRNHVNFSG